MSHLLWRLGHGCAAHPWRVVSAWLTLLVVVLGLSTAFGSAPRDSYAVPGSPSQEAGELLRDHFPAMSGGEARVLLRDERGGTLSADLLAAVSTRIQGLPDVGAVSPARVSADGDTALVPVQYTRLVTDLEPADVVAGLEEATTPARDAGLQVVLGGQVPEDAYEPSGTAEVVGVVVALGVLLWAFGSVVSAGLPLVVALLALGIGSAGFALLARVMSVSEGAPFIAAMVGVGVGIDYSLLLVTRHAEGLRAGRPVREAAADATATAGQSVVFAGVTVLVSLLGMRLAVLPTFLSVGVTTGLVVLLTVAAAITLVPALCGLAGTRVLPRRERRGERRGEPRTHRLRRRSATPSQGDATTRWALRVTRNPLPWALGALLVLLALAAPSLGMRTWPLDSGAQPAGSQVRLAHDLAAEEFGPGANGPLLVTVDTAQVPDPAAVRDQLVGLPGLAQVAQVVVSPDGRAAVIVAEPVWEATDDRASDLVRELRAEVLPAGAGVTGPTAVYVDTSEVLGERLWLVVGFVVLASLLLLVLVFRSVVVAVKAAVLNLLSVGAAYGVLTMVFQWGWGSSLLGFPGGVPVSSFVPILLFTILFGLSMDYEVFLLSRIRERWLATGDTTTSVVEGLAATGRVITCAALIMVSVFTGFALEGHIAIKMIGVGLATAIAVDATLVRLVLVPATMVLLGRANWWLPGWLDRVLPHFELEGRVPGAPAGSVPQQGGAPADSPVLR